MTDAQETFEIWPAALLDNPVVVSVPHAGLDVPAEDADVLALRGRQLQRDADLYVDRLVSEVPQLNVPVLRARVSRYVLDVNRGPDDVDREVCPGFERPARPSPRGLCWRLTTDNTPVLLRPLHKAEVTSRIERIHAPYHEALARLLEERRARFGFALLLDMHSMPSLGRPGHADSGARRADVVPGDARGASCAPVVSRSVVQHFEQAGYRVRPNDPYMGGFITRHHGRPQHSIHAIQVELNRDLYMDEADLSYDETRANRLIPHVLRLVERLRSLDLRR